MKLAINFTNFGPYHLARLRALATMLRSRGDQLIAYETASKERLYPWAVDRGSEPFEWVTLFPGIALEDLSTVEASLAIEDALDRDQPDAVAVAGYVRPEAVATARWARHSGRSTILMSESQEIDRPRTWWREAIKRRRLRLFDAALVGGFSHRDYLITLGFPVSKISFGYNAVDNKHFSEQAAQARQKPQPHQGIPSNRFFLSVSRFAPEKNLEALIQAYSDYRNEVGPSEAWDLVLCGDGPSSASIDQAIQASGHGAWIHRPGFLSATQLPSWYARASAFVLASVSEPWGLVVNEAAASGLPLLVSDRAGAARTLVPDPLGTTGFRFDPADPESIGWALGVMASTREVEREEMGRRASEIVSVWGPERFAAGMREALESAGLSTSKRRFRAIA